MSLTYILRVAVTSSNNNNKQKNNKARQSKANKTQADIDDGPRLGVFLIVSYWKIQDVVLDISSLKQIISCPRLVSMLATKLVATSWFG